MHAQRSVPAQPEQLAVHTGELAGPCGSGPDDGIGGAVRFVATGRGFMSSFLGDAGTRVRLFEHCIRWDRVIVAAQDGRIVGYLTFKMDGEGPYTPHWKDFRRVYGRLSCWWRFALFVVIERRWQSKQMYICGLKVREECRGEAEGRARAAGKRRIDLEVDADNHEARQLYAQAGYLMFKEKALRGLARFLPFSRVCLMRKDM
jgi:ribosomal protein S18 acetylase RimI-like enzyme